MATSPEQRRAHRFQFEQLTTEIEVGGVNYPVRVSDMSEGGIRILLDDDVEINPDEEVKVAVGKISPNVRGRVRWATAAAPGQPAQLGVQFESFILDQPAAEEVDDLLDAWRDITHSYTVFDSFLHILFTLDSDIVEGKIDDLSEVVYSITVWMDERVGPLNLWGVLKEPNGLTTAQLLAARHAQPRDREAARTEHVVKVAQDELTGWLDGRPYLFGGEVVIEYLGDNEGQVELLQRLAVILSKRIHFWSKLLMKNISLQLFGEELERLHQR